MGVAVHGVTCISFDRSTRMVAASQPDIGHECTASDLATTDLFKIEATDTCDVAHEQLIERGYDVAPVIENDEPLGFIGAAACQESSSGRQSVSIQ